MKQMPYALAMVWIPLRAAGTIAATLFLVHFTYGSAKRGVWRTKLGEVTASHRPMLFYTMVVWGALVCVICAVGSALMARFSYQLRTGEVRW
jgi:hypothetical protein